ncbi:cytochrome P450 [Russula dissimulans]|nr:cytochrome P450 [Russula dissimulans]
MDAYPLFPSFQRAILISALASSVYGLLRVIYNLFFHPLAHFPGPRGAACTRWWLAYTELGRGISLATLRKELHQKYGDIIRIAPNELHFSRPSVYNEIYNPQNKWDKDYQLYRAFDADQSFFTQTLYRDAKHGRSLIANLFSKKAISELQHLIRGQLDRFCNALKEQYADAMPTVTLAKYSAPFLWIVRNFPYKILKIISPTMKGLVAFKEGIEVQSKAVLKNRKLLESASHRIIYSEFLNPENNKGHPTPTALRLQHEALVLFAAGSHTVGTTLMIGAYHLLRSPDMKQRVVEELLAAWPVLDQPPSYEELEKLPFLASTFDQTLRIAVPTPAGLPRVVPPSGAVISGTKIPGGAVVSQSALFVSFSEEVFERPHEFLPDRWLQPGSKSLENWIVVFSKGPRSCIGINLAYCEIYLTLAYLFRRFDLRLDPAK